MNFFIPVFQSREPAFAPYRTPAIDVLTDGGPLMFAPPAAPLILSVTYGRLDFVPVDRATSYKLYRLSGTGYQTVPSHWANGELFSAYLEATGLFVITAANEAGESPASNSVILLPPPGTTITTSDSDFVTVDSMEITADEG